MGTRSLTVFKESDGQEIVVLYRQFDGYPSGHGLELAEFLNGITIVNGIPGGAEGRMANGMGCLAAQVIAHFKTEVGGFYLYPAGSRDHWEEFIYTVSGQTGEPLIIEVTDSGGKPLFNGPISDFIVFCQS